MVACSEMVPSKELVAIKEMEGEAAETNTSGARARTDLTQRISKEHIP
jgi:hypothetical protein